MILSMNTASKAASAIPLLILALGLTGAALWVTYAPPIPLYEVEAQTNARDLKAQMEKAFLEHTVVAGMHLQLVYDGKDTAPTKKLMTDNTAKLTNTIKSAYGDETARNFQTLWNRHVTEYEKFTMALKERDPNRMQEAQNNLGRIAQDLGKLLDQRSENISQAAFTLHMNEHISGTLSLIEAYAQNDIDGMLGHMEQGADQAKGFADMLADNIAADRGLR